MAIQAFDVNAPAVKKLHSNLLHPLKLKWFFWSKLPSLLFWRVKLTELTAEKAVVEIPFIKKTQNPFKSIYFAAQAGAAEFSTGVLALTAIEGRGKVSMLVTGLRSQYYKKATGTIRFVCEDAKAVVKTVDEALKTGEGQKFTMTSHGYNADNEVASTFWIEWSFRKK